MNAPGNPPLIELQGLTKTYGTGDAAFQALKGIDLTIRAGEFVAIIGPSGSGKSTLMNVLGCLSRPTSGSYKLGGVEVSGLSRDQRARIRNERIGFVFQNFQLLPRTTALEQVMMPLDYSPRRVSSKEGRARAEELLERVGLKDRMHHLPNQMSGGQQQRVAIARSLINRPSILFADEPTGNLDSRSGGEILKFMRTAVDEFHQSIVMVTHDPVAASYADRVVFLADGRVVDEILDPTAEAVLERQLRFGV